MGHQIIETAWNGAATTQTVEALLLVGTLVTSRVILAKMISETLTLLFSTLSKVGIPSNVTDNCKVCSRSQEAEQ